MHKTILAALALFSATAMAQPAAQHGDGPCKQVKEACEKAGFVKGEAKEGKGLWRDCINPVMQGTTAAKSKLPLPSVDASVVAACKQKHPKFGAGKVAN
jgi:hypothetical protein